MYTKTELNSIYRVLAWMGLSSHQPLFRKNSPFHNTILCIPSLIQTIILIAEVWIVLASPFEVFRSSTTVGAFTNIFQVLGILFAGMIQILENVWKGGLDKSIKESIGDFDRRIFNRHSCQIPSNCSFAQEQSQRRFLISQTIYLLFVPIMINMSILLTIPDRDKIWQQSILVREFTVNMIHIGLINVVCHFHWIRNRLQYVHKELRKLIHAAQIEQHRLKKNSKRTFVELKKLKLFYGQLWKISVQINERFKCFICSVLTIYFCTTSISIYWVVFRVQFKRWDGMWQACAIHLTMPHTVIVLVQEIECWRTITNQITKTLFVTKNSDCVFSQKIRRFMYMIYLCPLRFSVMSFYELNSTIYVGMVSVITTYIFLLFSLTPQN